MISREESLWAILLSRIVEGGCTPVLGAGVNVSSEWHDTKGFHLGPSLHDSWQWTSETILTARLSTIPTLLRSHKPMNINGAE